ncbi:MAG: large-conductance mechanosensitive channel protein MscL [Chlorobi bacterium]|nr:large-conductance mechanosensitive channel protein MscL [Chlorobiota bacterium]MCI0717008.1 large-conductance mechanosensitive channel protein MscL [Chlorobiota bacterium]
MIKEFKEFISRGSVIDLAVGIIIGAAFGKIVSSLVNDVLMPPIGMLIGGINFTGLKLVIKEASGTAEAVTINYGNFIQTGIDFLIIAFAIFILIKGINKLRRKQDEKPAPPKEPTNEEKLLTEIRDLLAKK